MKKGAVLWNADFPGVVFRSGVAAITVVFIGIGYAVQAIGDVVTN